MAGWISRTSSRQPRRPYLMGDAADAQSALVPHDPELARQVRG